jgi:2-dehydro-3-deoxyphosphogluconate aldolase / (4S)-4-hydroxy-2-oxoglutarate aldolase
MADDCAALVSSRLIPVVVVDDVSSAAPLARALVSGGLPVAEVAFRSDAAADAIRAIVDAGMTEGPDPILVGAGTVVTPDQVDAAVAAGARFVVSPGLSRAVVERCREHDVPVVAGAVTATEVQASLELGLDVMKFFPSATSGGTAAIKALAAPFPQVRFIPPGGVGPDNLADYLALPTVAAVGGSWMVPADLVRARAVDELRERAAAAVALVASVPEVA